jgi:hypothetical protein
MLNHIPQPAQEVAAAIREATRALPVRGPQEVTTHDGVILQMYLRCPPLFDGVVALLEKGLPEEALFLGRALFDESLQLQELADAAESQRIGLVVGREENSIDRNRRLMRLAIELGLETEVTNLEAAKRIDDRERSLAGYARRHGATGTAFEKPHAAARRYGRLEDYWSRELAHQMVHGNDAAMIYRRWKISPDTLVLANRTIDPIVVSAAMCFAGRSFILARGAASKIFSWGEEHALASLSVRLKSLEPEVGQAPST